MTRVLTVLLVGITGASCTAETPTSVPVAPLAAEPRYLTFGTGFMDLWPAFSPDGQSVLFSRSFDNGSHWSLWIVEVSGGKPRRFARSELPVSATRANWSAVSGRIAFTGVSETGQASVWTIDADGTNAREHPVPGLSGRVFYPAWFPNGKEVAVMDGQELVIKRVNLVAGRVTALTRSKQMLSGMPSVSADGKWIAFAGQQNAGQHYNQLNNVVWILSIADGTLRQLESPAAQGRAPRWSPDGKRVAFESDRGGFLRRQYAVYVIGRDGSGLQQITDYSLNANHPAWSPDGRCLAFSVRDPQRATESRMAVVELPGDDLSAVPAEPGRHYSHPVGAL